MDNLNNYKNITSIIDTKIIKKNIDFLRKTSKSDIMAVIKSNAYGHGIIGMSKVCNYLKIKYVGVSSLVEALLVRNSGYKGIILTWLYNIYNKSSIKKGIELNIEFALFDENHIKKFEKLIPKNKKINVHLLVDTGFNRTGIPYESSIHVAEIINNNQKMNLVGLMSHFVDSEVKNSKICLEQLRKFRTLRDKLFTMNIKPKYVHIANTYGALNYDVSDFTFSRCGKGIYGLIEPEINIKLNTIMTLTTNIIQIKKIKKGEGIGYNHKYISPKNMYICIIPIGFGDIPIFKSWSKLYVFCNNSYRKVLGLIGSDQMVIDGKKIDKLNDTIIICSNIKKYNQTLLNIAKKSNMLNSQLVDHIGSKIKYEYI